jgi:hypothetical protein
VIPVTVSYLGEFMDGPHYQAAVTQVDCQAGNPAEARQGFVEAWNEATGEERTIEDFAFTDL